MSNPTPITVNENKASSKYIDRNPPLATDPDLNRKVVDYLAYLKEILNFSVATTGKRITDTSGYVNELVRTSNSLISTIYDTQNGLVSKVEQNANSISLVVDSTTSTINAASIVAAINGSGSSVQINADHIVLTGYVKFTNLSTAGEATINGGNIQANTLTLTSFDSTAQAALITGTTVKNQYYLSTSSSSATGGSWGDTVPAWSSGKYVWTRIRTTKTYASGTETFTNSTAVYDENLTTALSTAASASTAASNAATAAGTAQTTANGALASTVSCYYRSTSSTTPTISTSTSIGTAADTSNAWEYVMPRPKNGCYFFTCEKYTTRGGTVSFSTVRQMANATYTSLWCSATDSSYVDGAAIYTGSLTADKIKANETFTQKLYAQDLNITGGSVNITTASETVDKIVLNSGNFSSAFSPSGLGVSLTDIYNDGYEFSYKAQGLGMFKNGTSMGYLTIGSPDATLVLGNSSASIGGNLEVHSTSTRIIAFADSVQIQDLTNNARRASLSYNTITDSGSLTFGSGSGGTMRMELINTGLTFYNSSGTQTAKYPESLTASRALVTSTNGIVAVSSVTATELGYLSGVTSAIQTQLNNKQASLSTSSGTLTFASGWTKVDGETDTSVLRYTHCRKYGKVVELAVSANTSSSHSGWNTVCTIPSGYRPSHPFTTLGYSNDNDSNAIFRVNTAGEVMVYGDKRQPTLHVSYVLD